MTTRKNTTNEHLAKVLEFSIQELQKDLKTFSEEEKKLLTAHIDVIKKELSKEIIVDTQKIDNLLKNFENRFNQKAERHISILEKQKKEMRPFYVTSTLFFLSVVILFASYLFGIKGADKIRSEYYQDLKSEGKLIENEQDVDFIKSWKVWAEKNPKDSQKIREIINK